MDTHYPWMVGMDDVDRPAHYNHGKMETIEAIEGLDLGYFESNILKYISRWKYKHSEREKQLEDLYKAKWYLERLIANEQRAE